VADAEAEDEAAGVGLSEGAAPVRGGHRIAGVDVGDPRRDDDALATTQEEAGVAHDLLGADTLGDPDGAVAHGLEVRHGLARHARRVGLQGKAPNAESTQPFRGCATTDPLGHTPSCLLDPLRESLREPAILSASRCPIMCGEWMRRTSKATCRGSERREAGLKAGQGRCDGAAASFG
jgi:hypothetical protein